MHNMYVYIKSTCMDMYVHVYVYNYITGTSTIVSGVLGSTDRLSKFHVQTADWKKHIHVQYSIHVGTMYMYIKLMIFDSVIDCESKCNRSQLL